MTDKSDWTISIYVPEAAAATVTTTLPVDESENHSLRDIAAAVRHIAVVKAEKVQDQWNRTLDTLMHLSSEVARRAGAWTIDEIEVGFTLSAKGELLFIAEAGAEASIKLTLKPKP